MHRSDRILRGVAPVRSASRALLFNVSEPNQPRADQRPWHITRTLLGPIGSPIYAMAVARRNRRFDRGDGVQRLPLPVISVGNLTTGGTGKTPMVTLLARHLLSLGHRPSIAMRGYKSSAGHTPDGGDEADTYRRTLPGVAVIANPHRHTAVLDHLRQEEAARRPLPTVLLLDDGFQHRQIHRDLDILLIHQQVNLLRERLLPGGDLREPLSSAARANIVISTGWPESGDGTLPQGHWLHRWPTQLPPPSAMAAHHWSGVLTGDQSVEALPLSILREQRVYLLAAIGRPEAFLSQAERFTRVVGRRLLADHDPLVTSTVNQAVSSARAAGAQALLVTEKDWSKLRLRDPALFAGLPVYRPQLEMRLIAGEREALAAVANAAGHRTGP